MESLDICRTYLKEQHCDKTCQRLHICQLHLLSDSCNTTCPQRYASSDSKIVKTCNLTHKLLSPHNYGILRKIPAIRSILNGSESKVLRDVRTFVQNNRRRGTVPLVCVSPSVEQCSKGGKCQRLHVCFNYVVGKCKDRCKSQLHDVTNFSNRPVLAAYAIDNTHEIKARETLARWYNKLDIKVAGVAALSSSKIKTHGAASSPSTRDQPRVSMSKEICCNYLEGKCSDAAKCQRFHDPNKLTYCWEYMQLTRDKEWILFSKSEMKKIEKSYCDPSNSSCHTSINGHLTEILFNSMSACITGEVYQIRRLSTPKMARRTRCNPAVATEWVWYDNMHQDQWQPIAWGVSMENLDAMMTRSPNGCHKFTLRDKSVEFKFKDMVLYTTKNTQRLCDVRRRPVLKIPSVKQRETSNDPVLTRSSDCSESTTDRTACKKDKVADVNKDGLQTCDEHGEIVIITEELSYQEICIDFFLGMCGFDKDCPYYHSNYPYQWQWLLDNEWITFDAYNNTLLEDKYCDGNVDSVTIQHVEDDHLLCGAQLSFPNMKMEKFNATGVLVNKYKIKRLSTPSYGSLDIIKKAEKYYTTWWWYEQTENGTWKLQDKLTISKWEARFQVDSNSLFACLTRGGDYVHVDLRSMTKKTSFLDHDKCDSIKRRPAPWSEHIGICEAAQDKTDMSGICVSHLNNKCSDGEKCSSVHSNRPFLWQHTANDTWEDFEDHENVKIEKAYCSLKDTIDNVTLHPNKNVTYVLKFSTLNLKSQSVSYRVRRLCTTSTITPDNTEAMDCHTHWKWYQRSKTTDIWEEACVNDHNMSDHYEKCYQLSSAEELLVTRNDSCHIVNVKKMLESNDQGYCVYDLCRRPQYINKLKPGSMDEIPICVKHLSLQCTFTTKCNKHHEEEAYSWKFKGDTWESFSLEENRALEEAYRDVTQTTVNTLKGEVNFDSFTLHVLMCGYADVRRFSTPSSVTADDGNDVQLYTEWTWYWQDDDGSWKMYDPPANMRSIESHYLEDKEGHLELNLNEQRYLIDFHTMTQTNLMSKQQRDIRRRPDDSKDLQSIKDRRLRKEKEMQKIKDERLRKENEMQKINDERLRKEKEMQKINDERLRKEKEMQKIKDERLRKEKEMQTIAAMEKAKQLQKIEDDELKKEIAIPSKAEQKESTTLQRIEEWKIRRKIERQRRAEQEEEKTITKG